MELVFPVLAGFTLGIVHAFDVDHVVAVTAFASTSPRRRSAARFGFLWGLGHTATLLVIGIVSVALKVIIPPAVASAAEVLVGILLVAIGIWVLRDVVQKRRLHIHRHSHDNVLHIHLHSHGQFEHHRHEHSMFLVGATHGFAGSAAVMIILPVAISQSLLGAALYLLLFGIGTIVAMSAFALALGSAARRIASPLGLAAFQALSGFASIAIGLVWIGGVLLT